MFGKSKSTISEHIKNIFEEGELNIDSVVRNFRTTASDGKEYDTNYYNLDVIISVGYRVKSHQGTQFRIWAMQRLREYIIKGFTLNDERFTSGSSMNYFKEHLNSIKENPEYAVVAYRALPGLICRLGLVAVFQLPLSV